MRERTIPKIPSGAKKKRLIVGTLILLAASFLIVVGVFALLVSALPSFTGKCVAVVDVNMPFTVEGSPTSLVDMGYPSSEELADVIKELNYRNDVGAVLFIFNSGGGSVVATHEIYDAVEELDTPTVSYFREVAASGAYYVASETDYIVSDPATITGNIGVRSVAFLSFEALIRNLGINATVVTSGDYKDIGSPYRNMSEEEQVIVQSIIDEIFQEFKSIVIENRRGKLNMEKFDEITDGRILSGRQAYEIGLVDELGNKDDAIMKAAELGGMEFETVDDIRVCYTEVIPREGSLFSADSFIGGISESLGSIVPRFQ